MAKRLNLRVAAEGVENEAQFSFLRAHQCDEIQGYFASRPLTADEVAERLLASDLLLPQSLVSVQATNAVAYT